MLMSMCFLWVHIVILRVGLGISLGLEVVHLGVIRLDHSTVLILKVTTVRVAELHDFSLKHHENNEE
jgi:hypothetical protein